MKTTPHVSVIIPTYNRCSTLKFAIQSVLWQTFKDYELLVVGDACTDNSQELVISYNDPRVIWYNLSENSGYQSVPNNEGIKRAKGVYIAYLNHDDMWLPNHLDVLVNKIETTNAHFAYSILEWIYSFKKPAPDIPNYPFAAHSPEATAILHRKDVIEKIGYWKNPEEVYSVPRVDLFRRAEFSGMKFAFAARLTALKFLWDEVHYSDAGPQRKIYHSILNEPDFVEVELSEMLARAQFELDKPITWKRFKTQLIKFLKSELIKIKVDPARLYFWHKAGKQIRDWRKAHRLDN